MPAHSIIARGIRKTYVQGPRTIEVLKGIDLEIQNGEIVALVGPSGAGKSTLLHVLGLMDRATEGGLELLGKAIAGAREEELDGFRNRHVGFLFQFHYLLPELTLLENCALPLRIAGRPSDKANLRASELLESVGLKPREDHLPSQVSGGEQQRAALARAMANRPSLLLCDEPTGNLDLESGEEVRDLIWRAARAQHCTVVVATHNSDIAGSADRILRIADGRIAPDRSP
ncbi:MAG: hypothetical protein A2636_05950 [Elusimicrobia bacterium RIFCSPHIGHO2_01_FULL_64_10]|nr:MAG: hypothetical protein A2636_05950 [Elusimicrobia bacterium RIFCSPHIGHO2_01_FULL_64_10]